MALLKTVQVAAILKVSAGTLRRWRHEGKGPPFVKFERTVRYDESELRNWIGGAKHGLGGNADERRTADER